MTPGEEQTKKEEPTCFYEVVVDRGGRMYNCRHAHGTLEAAMACVEESNGLCVMEWKKDRDPQFEQVWIRADMVDGN